MGEKMMNKGATSLLTKRYNSACIPHHIYVSGRIT